MDVTLSIALGLAAFFIGAVPWGLVLGKWLKGVDIRKSGSGATGTTNSLRILGWRIALAIFLLDFGKGVLPVVLARWWDLPDWAVALAAVAATAGHCWSPYIRMKGGKGMATGGGASVAMFPWLVLFLLFVIAVVWVTRYVSLASILTALIGPTVVVILAFMGKVPGWWAAGIVGVGIIIVIQHRSNIKRLLNGTENKFGQRVSAPPSEQSA
ncbi:MAG: glycerol-3-phosphate 1-O-acyltransferase PlsY [Thermomicrobiales bacterium]|nr:glycerol-3-phosphate 1-O-acyltransferase PlsY [Thermomicrobiales bacterium]